MEQGGGDMATQLAELKATVEMQGEMMQKLIRLLEKEHGGKGKQRAHAQPTGTNVNGSAYESEQVWG